MTYSSGGLIQAQDYNDRATTVNSIWGTGSGANGYGQSTTLSTVSAATTAAATEWATLVSRLDSIRNHQSGTTSGVTSPVSGGVITYLSAIDTNLTTIQTNKLAANTRGTASPTGYGNPVMSSATAWVTSSTKEFSVTFTSTDTVRYFFNAGGQITFYCRVNSGTTTKATDWNTFLTNTLGTITFGSNSCSRSGTGGDQGSASPGGSPTQNTSIGFHNLTTSYQTLFAIGSTSATADYGNNYVTVEAKVGGTLYGASSNIVYFRVIMYDAATDTFNDTVAGTTALYAGYVPPETTYLTNTWSTQTITTVTNTQA
jgi:hypothetical protein